MNTTDRSDPSLRAFVRKRAPLRPQRAALFAAELAEHLADRHADGVVQGGLADTVRVRETDGGHRPVLGRASGRDGAAESDVRELGVVVAQLLGVRPPSPDEPPPPGIPDPLWTVLVDTQHADRTRRPPAAVVARRFRDAARDLLLAEASWPSAVAPPDYVPGADEPDAEDPDPPAGRTRRRRTLVVSGAVVVLLIAAVALAVTIGGGGNGGPAGGNGSSQSGNRPSAGAPGPPVQVCLDPNCVAQVTFRPDGDRLSVCDKAKDGRSAVAVYTRADQPGEKSVWASKGEGTCVDRNVEIPARTRVTVKACTGERAENRIVACSNPVTATS